MKSKRIPYNFLHRLSAVFMILTLCWLTVSMPFIIDFQEKMSKLQQTENTRSLAGGQDEDSRPISSNTEEKVPGSNNSFSEEYMHHQHITHHYFFSESSEYHKSENTGTYTAFHGELHVPPPNAAWACISHYGNIRIAPSVLKQPLYINKQAAWLLNHTVRHTRYLNQATYDLQQKYHQHRTAAGRPGSFCRNKKPWQRQLKMYRYKK